MLGLKWLHPFSGGWGRGRGGRWRQRRVLRSSWLSFGGWRGTRGSGMPVDISLFFWGGSFKQGVLNAVLLFRMAVTWKGKNCSRGWKPGSGKNWCLLRTRWKCCSRWWGAASGRVAGQSLIFCSHMLRASSNHYLRLTRAPARRSRWRNAPEKHSVSARCILSF